MARNIIMHPLENKRNYSSGWRAALAGAVFFAAIYSPAFAQEGASEAAQTAAALTAGAAKESIRSESGNFLALQYARAKGDPRATIQFLRESLKKEPENVELRGQLMVLLVLTGNMPEAAEIAAKLEDAKPKELITDLILMVSRAQSGEVTDAQDALRRTISQAPGNLWLPLMDTWLDIAQGKRKKILTIKELTAKPGSLSPLLHYHVGLVNLQSGHEKQGLSDLEKAATDQTNIPFRVFEVLAGEYKARGQDAKLEKLIKNFRASHPDLTFATERDDLFEAARVRSAQDGVAEVLFTMASILYGADAAQDAQIYLRLALYLKPDFSAAQMILASLLETEGNFAEANVIYGQISPKSAFADRAALRTALNEDRLGNQAKALDSLDALAKADTTRYDALVAKGDVLRAHEQYADAVKAYTAAIERAGELQNRHWPLFFARGACYERAGEWAKAENDLQKALELNPDQPEVLNYLAYGWVARNERLEEARDMLEKAASLRPDEGAILDSLGWAYYQMGNYDMAANYLEKAIELMPSDATVNEHLGDAYWRSGRRTEANFQWERALVYSPEAGQEQSIRKKIAQGMPAIKSVIPVPVVAEPAEKAPVTVEKTSATPAVEEVPLNVVPAAGKPEVQGNVAP